MRRALLSALLMLIGIFLIDQGIKEWMVLHAMEQYGLRQSMLYERLLPLYETRCIDVSLVFNKGVAFSLFAFLEESLKWLQLVLIAGMMGYALYVRKACYMLPVGLLSGAALSNVYDRFVHGGVVDYVHWHCGFDFAIFNMADVMIDIAVVWLILLNLKPAWCRFSKKINE